MTYKELKVGDKFIFEGNRYIKTEKCRFGFFRNGLDYIICNCVNLNSGAFGFVGNSANITLDELHES